MCVPCSGQAVISSVGARGLSTLCARDLIYGEESGCKTDENHQ